MPSSSRSEFSNSPAFQASAIKYMRTAFLWVITLHISGDNPDERSTQLPWNSPSLMMKASRFFSPSQNANPETKRHIPEDSERHRLCCRTPQILYTLFLHCRDTGSRVTDQHAALLFKTFGVLFSFLKLTAELGYLRLFTYSLGQLLR